MNFFTVLVTFSVTILIQLNNNYCAVSQLMIEIDGKSYSLNTYLKRLDTEIQNMDIRNKITQNSATVVDSLKITRPSEQSTESTEKLNLEKHLDLNLLKLLDACIDRKKDSLHEFARCFEVTLGTIEGTTPKSFMRPSASTSFDPIDHDLHDDYDTSIRNSGNDNDASISYSLDSNLKLLEGIKQNMNSMDKIIQSSPKDGTSKIIRPAEQSTESTGKLDLGYKKAELISECLDSLKLSVDNPRCLDVTYTTERTTPKSFMTPIASTMFEFVDYGIDYDFDDTALNTIERNPPNSFTTPRASTTLDPTNHDSHDIHDDDDTSIRNGDNDASISYSLDANLKLLERITQNLNSVNKIIQNSNDDPLKNIRPVKQSTENTEQLDLRYKKSELIDECLDSLIFSVDISGCFDVTLDTTERTTSSASTTFEFIDYGIDHDFNDTALGNVEQNTLNSFMTPSASTTLDTIVNGLDYGINVYDVFDNDDDDASIWSKVLQCKKTGFHTDLCSRNLLIFLKAFDYDAYNECKMSEFKSLVCRIKVVNLIEKYESVPV